MRFFLVAFPWLIILAMLGLVGYRFAVYGRMTAKPVKRGTLAKGL